MSTTASSASRPTSRTPIAGVTSAPRAAPPTSFIEHPRRITAPMKRVGDRYVEASWDEAISDIASRLRGIIDRDGPDAVGFYWGNPGGF